MDLKHRPPPELASSSWNPQHELLLCHVTGQDHWDSLAGGRYDGESPPVGGRLVRDARRETGL